MLAFQPASVLTSVMKKLEKFTDATITKPQRLMADLQEICRTGIAIQREEWRLGVTGIGAPIFDGTGRVIAGLGITAPAARFTAKKCKELGRSCAVSRCGPRISLATPAPNCQK